MQVVNITLLSVQLNTAIYMSNEKESNNEIK